MSVLLFGIGLLAIAAIFALVHSVIHADEGFEDSTGYHSLKANATAPGAQNPFALYEKLRGTVDTGNPWDYVEGSACPWERPRRGHDQHHSPA